MKELIDHIPFLDVIIISTIAMLVYVGWKQGVPKAFMICGAIYSGFLLASIYYHLFAVAMARLFDIKSAFVADLVSFLVLDTVISVLMVALLLGLFGHMQIGGRLAVFDRMFGATLGAVAGLLIMVMLVTVLHVPYEANKQNVDLATKVPAVIMFNDGYDKSALAPQVVKLAPMLVKGTAPMLPDEARAKGAVPLLEAAVTKKP